MRLPSAALLALAVWAPASAQTPEMIFRADPPPALSAFQWALASEGALLLAPDGDALRPARRAGPGVIETLPPALPIAFHGEEETRAAPLTAILSPLEIDPEGWVMEVRSGDVWVAAEWWFFDQMRFHRRVAPGAYETPELSDLRFRAR